MQISSISNNKTAFSGVLHIARANNSIFTDAAATSIQNRFNNLTKDIPGKLFVAENLFGKNSQISFSDGDVFFQTFHIDPRCSENGLLSDLLTLFTSYKKNRKLVDASFVTRKNFNCISNPK